MLGDLATDCMNLSKASTSVDIPGEVSMMKTNVSSFISPRNNSSFRCPISFIMPFSAYGKQMNIIQSPVSATTLTVKIFNNIKKTFCLTFVNKKEWSMVNCGWGGRVVETEMWRQLGICCLFVDTATDHGKFFCCTKWAFTVSTFSETRCNLTSWYCE